MTIVLMYTTEDGTKEQVEFQNDVVEVDLSYRRITSIDLTPLSSCSSLQKLYLYSNQLQTIDLAPLSSCSSLQALHLDGNQLQTIDLAPLSSCSSLQTLNLYSNQLQSIDLAPLSSCSSLQTLNLYNTQLQTIDLAPLSSCPNLQALTLSDTQLQTIDLAPLSSCSSLQKLWLDRNQLQTIDLAPLSSCSSLQALNLQVNQLQTIDLAPLSSCSSLQKLNLAVNQLQTIDLAPLSSCSSLQKLYLHENLLQTNDAVHSWLPLSTATREAVYTTPPREVVYARPTDTYTWQFLLRVAQEQGTNWRVQQDILHALGLGEYGFIDHDLADLFRSIPVDTSVELAREHVAKILVNEIVRAVDTDGATTGFKVEELLAQHGEIAVRTQRIIELRGVEMQRVVVGVSDTEVDLRELYLTAYGYNILTALSMHLTTNLEGLERVRTALGELGFELKTGETSKSGVKMSNDLTEVIWWILKNKGRPWNEIEESAI